MPTDPEMMYRWRRYSNDERSQILAERQTRKHPPHSPAHIQSDQTDYYMVTAACYEHRHIIGASMERLALFSNQLCDTLYSHCRKVFAWVVLTNHYHVLVDCPGLKNLFHDLGKLHGRLSYQWNGEDRKRGRQVWCKAAETMMKSERHFYASVNYVFNNPVHHGYCAKWTDWPFSNASGYLDTVGREKALQVWKAYPLLDYGKDWDPPEL